MLKQTLAMGIFVLAAPFCSISCVYPDRPEAVVDWRRVAVTSCGESPCEGNSCEALTVNNKVRERKTKGVVVVYASPAPVSVTPVSADKREEQGFRVVQVSVTAYCPCERCCGPRAQGLTALETSAWNPGIACDWTWLDPGTVVEIEGYGKYPIDDKGGRMKKKYWRNNIPKMDVRMTYHWQARNWGTKLMEVKIYDVR
jgi:3D (Asp-Asp-Asp) domain-containing protein